MIEKLASAHVLSYGIYGETKSPRKFAVVMHGFPGSHLQASVFDQVGKSDGILIFAPDRPGYGDSSHKKIDLWLTDVSNFLVNKYPSANWNIVGISGGAPSAYLLAERLVPNTKSLHFVAGLPPYSSTFYKTFPQFHRSALSLVRHLPQSWLEKISAQLAVRVDPAKKIEIWAERLPTCDSRFLLDPQIRPVILESMKFARKQKLRGVALDAKLFATNWLRQNFTPPPFHIWHGELDVIIPIRMIYPWRSLQGFKFNEHLFPNEGHYSLPILRAAEISQIFE